MIEKNINYLDELLSKYEEGLITPVLPGTAWTFDENNKVIPDTTIKINIHKSDLKNNKCSDDIIGHIIVSYDVWNLMDSESLAGEGDYIRTYFRENFKNIVWH